MIHNTGPDEVLLDLLRGDVGNANSEILKDAAATVGGLAMIGLGYKLGDQVGLVDIHPIYYVKRIFTLGGGILAVGGITEATTTWLQNRRSRDELSARNQTNRDFSRLIEESGLNSSDPSDPFSADK